MLPVADSVVEVGMEVSSSDKDVSGEMGANIWSDHPLIDSLIPIDSVCHFVFTISNYLL
jgi:hypothetical protein